MKKAFTLAEIMIALTLIGFLTATILTISLKASPDKNVVMFKKANATVLGAVSELVSLDKYYLGGDLGKKPDGSLIKDNNYFCASLTEVITNESFDCKSADINPEKNFDTYNSDVSKIKETLSQFETELNTTEPGGTITAQDNVVWIIPKAEPFGAQDKKACKKTMDNRTYGDPNGYWSPCRADENGFDVHYRALCFDVDGLAKGEIPFCYGIRSDGKAISSTRTDEWINKSVQKKD